MEQYKLYWTIQKKMLDESLSIRETAKKIGISFSALARILRRETRIPTPHVDHAIQTWVFPELTFPPCTCVRCVGRRKSILDTVKENTEAIGKLTERVSAIEQHLENTYSTVSPHLTHSVSPWMNNPP